jgi:iron(III) transport system substrate-binding protein
MTLKLFAASCAAVLLCSCSGGRSDQNTVVVYVSEARVFAEPILTDFQKASGIAVQAVYEAVDGKTAGLVDRLIAENNNPQADVYWANEPVRAELLRQRGVSTPYASLNAAGVPPQFKDPDGYWTGFSARARVILAKRDLDPRPEGLAAYTDPRHRGRAAIASPLSGAAAAQIVALFTGWGDERAGAFLDAMKKNEVKLAASSAESANLVVAGAADFALVDSADAVSRVRRNTHVEMIFPDQRPDQPGVLILPNAAVLVRGAPHPQNAKLLIDDLLSKETERRLAFDDCAQIPLHSGIETPPEIRRIEALHTMKVDFAALARKLNDIQPRLKAWATK